MDSGGYRIRHQQEIHFVTFAVVECVDVFTMKEYRDICSTALRFVRKTKVY